MNLIIFIFGLTIGSFLNVLALASVGKSSILKKQSQCPHCQTNLKWFDLIPVLSFVLLRGHCRYCGKKISYQYPSVELSTGFLFLFLFVIMKAGQINIQEFIFLVIFSSILISLFVTDFNFFLLPDKLILSGFAVVLLFFGSKLFSEGNWKFLITNLWGLAIGAGFFLLLFLITQGRAMGFGDVKLGALLGLVFGAREVIFIIFLSFILGSLIGIILMVLGRKKMKDAVPFGPFLIISVLPVIFAREQVEELLKWII